MEIKSRWSRHIYPCSNDKCDFVGKLDAFSWGQCYSPCPYCGAKRVKRTGKFIYKKVPIWWFPLFSKKVFLRVEWHSINP